jgi:membrane protein required for colicin V production
MDIGLSLNWLDIVLIVIIFITFLMGVIKGFVKQIIGILAVILGLILAVSYYSVVADIFSGLISNRLLANLLAFLAVFFAVVCVGSIISWLLSKLMKGPLKLVNHALGAGLGILKGILICGVIVFALFVFPVTTGGLKKSELAPFCARLAKAVYYLVPKDLRLKFNEAYEDIVKGGENEKRL